MSSFYPKVQPAVQESNSRVNTEFNTVTAIEVGLYNERFKSVLTNTPSTDSIDVNVVGGGGGGSTQYLIGDAAPNVGNLQLGVDDTSGDATVLMTTDPTISGINRLQVTDGPANSILTNLDFSLANLDGKITSGADTTLAAAQQVLVYGEVTSGAGTGELHPLHISQNGDLQVEISGLESTGQELMADSLPVVIASDQTAIESKLIAQDFTASPQHVKCDTNGKLIVQVDGVRTNGSETIVIPDTTTGTSSTISMGTHKYIAFYGDTDNTTNTNIFIEYSQDQTNWYRGAGDNAKIIIVSATGNFYDEEHVTPPYVRISRPNTSGSAETFELKYTLL